MSLLTSYIYVYICTLSTEAYEATVKYEIDWGCGTGAEVLGIAHQGVWTNQFTM